MKQLIYLNIVLVFSSFLIFSGCDQTKYKAKDGNKVEDPNPTTPTPDPNPTPDPVANTKLDILLVVDDSGSMMKDNQKLAAQLVGIARKLGSDNVDWQMCVTTTDVNYYEGRAILWRGNNDSHIVNASSNLSSVFMETITWIGHGWSDDEQGIKAMNMAINESANDDCFRNDTTLAIVIISDEDERSVGGKESLNSFQYKELDEENSPFVFMDSVFTNFGVSKKVVVHSIIVEDSDCKYTQDGEGSVSFIGTKYRELSTITKGSLSSICDTTYLTQTNLFGD